MELNLYKENKMGEQQRLHSLHLGGHTRESGVVLAGSDFTSVLSDSSQAHKTGSEKDLILTHVERGGLPCYFVTSLDEISHF